MSTIDLCQETTLHVIEQNKITLTLPKRAECSKDTDARHRAPETDINEVSQGCANGSEQSVRGTERETPFTKLKNKQTKNYSRHFVNLLSNLLIMTLYLKINFEIFQVTLGQGHHEMNRI